MYSNNVETARADSGNFVINNNLAVSANINGGSITTGGVATTEEFTGETVAVNVKTITTS